MAELTAKTSDRKLPTGIPLDYARPGTHGPFFERVIDVLKNLALVAPLTILIWIYAEREQTATRPNVLIPVEVTINAPGRIVTVKDPQVVATLSGPAASMDRVIAAIQATSAGHAIVQIALAPKINSG